ncbi:MAG: type II toxin-antitoxin system Phd/YefM family antitoxin [Clostridiaceae bacterium]|nr:type II toxin-antitoxin system Phd/YefM family antitoxin [Clostridiaceae bacterium]
MPIIRPVSELRNNFSEIETLTRNQPVFLTKNGVGTMVVLSIEDYDKQIAMFELYKKLAEAEAEIATGDVGKDYKAVIKGIREKING